MESGATVVSAFDLKELLGKVAELMALSIGVEACGISSWKKGEGVVCTLAEYSSAGRVVEGGGAYRLDDYPATAQLLYSGQPFQVRADDPTADERERIFLAEWPLASGMHKVSSPFCKYKSRMRKLQNSFGRIPVSARSRTISSSTTALVAPVFLARSACFFTN